MQEDPSLTRVGKRFRGNIEDTDQNRERHRAETLKELVNDLGRHLHCY